MYRMSVENPRTPISVVPQPDTWLVVHILNNEVDFQLDRKWEIGIYRYYYTHATHEEAKGWAGRQQAALWTT